ncbi:MAG: type IV pilin protein, partial [bacterium]
MSVRIPNSSGFTMVELLVVVAVIGILAAAAVPKVMDSIARSRATSCQQDLKALMKGAAKCRISSTCNVDADVQKQVFPSTDNWGEVLQK